jgi:cytochrome c
MKKILFVSSSLCAFFIIVVITNQSLATNNSYHVKGIKPELSELSSLIYMNPDSTKKSSEAKSGLDKGIGPFKDQAIELGPINPKWVSEGKGIFTSKCVLCHELDQKKIGPPLRNIAKDRAPQYILNMIVNPTKMQKGDPDVKILIKKYNNILMTELGISNDQARSVYEYLRSVER